MKKEENKPEIEPLEVIVHGIRIEDFIQPRLKEFFEKLYPDYEIRFSTLDIVLIKKKKEEKKEEKEEKKVIVMSIPPTNYITIRHRGEKDYFDKKVVIDARYEDILSQLLKKIDDLRGEKYE